MLKNYLLVSLRNLRRHFAYSFVNIFGLTIGLACTLVIGVWVYQEYSYDRHFKDADNIYRIGVNFFNIGNMAIGPELLTDKLKTYASVSHATSLATRGSQQFTIGNKDFQIDQCFGTDNDFFRVFSYDFKYGSAATALLDPQTIVITDLLAMQLFGKEDVVGESVQIKDENKVYQIVGVVDGSYKSHIPASVWFSTVGNKKDNSWTSASSYQYVKIEGDEPSKLLSGILDEQLDEIRSMFAPNETLEQFKEGGIYQFLSMPVKDIHLKSELKFEPSGTGDYKTTQIFAGIAFLILILASVNFINITTARSTTRAKEVGIRKSLGTRRNELIVQFIIESVIVCLISVTLAIVAGEVLLNVFERISGLTILPTLLAVPSQLFIIYGVAIIIGILAGIYPAIYITRFSAVKVLKGELETNEKGVFRNGLVLFQFTISICLLIVSIFIFNQLKYIEKKDMGFDMENVMVVNNIPSIGASASFMKEELLKKSYVRNVSLNKRMPASSNISVTSLNKNTEDEIWVQQFAGDEDITECLGFRILEGRDFSKEMATDTSALILNEAAVAALGIENPIGETLNDGRFRIIGVISDFNFESLKKKIGPAFLRLKKENPQNLSIKFDGAYSQQLIADINNLWANVGTEEGPSYYFLDANFENLVKEEKILSRAVVVFTILAMFISCLGLYGLSIFKAEQKTKEIGIRRVLGASAASIVKLLSKNFAKPILVAFLIATPIAFYVSNSWLESYAYRISIGWWPFVLGGGIALVLGISTISWQSLKAALRNPIISLRNE